MYIFVTLLCQNKRSAFYFILKTLTYFEPTSQFFFIGCDDLKRWEGIWIRVNYITFNHLSVLSALCRRPATFIHRIAPHTPRRRSPDRCPFEWCCITRCCLAMHIRTLYYFSSIPAFKWTCASVCECAYFCVCALWTLSGQSGLCTHTATQCRIHTTLFKDNWTCCGVYTSVLMIVLHVLKWLIFSHMFSIEKESQC